MGAGGVIGKNVGKNIFLASFSVNSLPGRGILLIRDYKSIRRTQKSKTSQAVPASRATDFNMHESSVSDAEFIILSRYELKQFFFFKFPPRLLRLLHLSSSNPEFGKQTNTFHGR